MAETYLDFEKPIIKLERKIEEMELFSNGQVDMGPEIEKMKEKVKQLRTKIYTNLTRWQRVQLARHPDRPYTNDYIERICDSFVELHGDRLYRDDPAIVAGLATIENKKIILIGQQKGRNTKSKVFRNFGMANPEGYRKALRVMRLGTKFNRPIVTLIDTPGAFPGIEAEERGQAEAIARNLFEMSRLPVPIVCIVIGEGASGGALGIGVGDRLLMMENTWYSVISPESCSSILWKTWDNKEKAAESLKLAPNDLLELKIIDGIINEPTEGAHRNFDEAAAILKKTILKEIKNLESITVSELLKNRVEKYAQMGKWTESEE